MGKLRLAIVELTTLDRAELESLASRRKTALTLRARIVLGCASDLQNKEVALRVGADPVTVTVGKWRRRFLADGIDGLRDEPRSGAPRTVDDARIEAVITRTLESLPSDATHWSSRGMARTSELSTSTVQRIWRAFGLHPTAKARSSCRPIPTLSTKCATWLVFMSRRLPMRLYCASMKSHRYRRLIEGGCQISCVSGGAGPILEKKGHDDATRDQARVTGRAAIRAFEA